MPRAPIKVGIVGFADINPTSRSRRVGGKETAGGTSFYERCWLGTRCYRKDTRFLSSMACTSIGKEYQPLEESDKGEETSDAGRFNR